MNRARIEQLWRKHPELTQEQVRKATGAPKATVRFVYARLVQRQVLRRPPQAEARLAQQA